MHEKVVTERTNRIALRKKMGLELKGLEAIEKNDQKFWKLKSEKQEVFFELNEPDFQKVINLLEAKGNNKKEDWIIKLNFMIRLRRKAG